MESILLFIKTGLFYLLLVDIILLSIAVINKNIYFLKFLLHNI
jgi:hypothetical protein